MFPFCKLVQICLSLIPGDRLEPSPILLDVADFDLINTFPVVVIFWSVASQSRALHRNPLFSEELGVGLHSLAIDILHTLYLGVVARWVVAALWLLVAILGTYGGTEEAKNQQAIEILRCELFSFYGRRYREHPKEKISELSTLTLNMLGTKKRPLLKAKADETKWLMYFCVEMLSKYPSAKTRYTPMLHAGQELVTLVETMKSSGKNVPQPALRKLHDSCQRHLKLCAEAGVPYTPKHHLFVHLVTRTAFMGNPKHYATFLDESLNFKIAQICRSCHRRTLEKRVFWKFGWSFGGLASGVYYI